jgi:hypothetical protein
MPADRLKPASPRLKNLFRREDGGTVNFLVIESPLV